MEAIQEYRETDFIKDFNTYKSYYKDAENQNREIQKEKNQDTLLKMNFSLDKVPSGASTKSLDFNNIQPRDRDNNVSFKDPR